MSKYKPAKLFIETMKGEPNLVGWVLEGDSWNGFSYVLMNKENADILAEMAPDAIEYIEETDSYREVLNDDYNVEEDIISWKGEFNDELGEKVYAIGSGYWTWNHEFMDNESEFNNHHNALKDFLRAANELCDNWDNEYPTIVDNLYPEYLPSFDEFLADMQGLLLKENDIRLKEWKKGIQ